MLGCVHKRVTEGHIQVWLTIGENLLQEDDYMG
jgi:hypothetical protein